MDYGKSFLTPVGLYLFLYTKEFLFFLCFVVFVINRVFIFFRQKWGTLPHKPLQISLYFRSEEIGKIKQLKSFVLLGSNCSYFQFA